MTQPKNNPAEKKPQGGGLPLRPILIALAIIALFTALGFVGYRLMDHDALATLVELDGETERDTAATMLSWKKAHVGDEFDVGDGARTSANAEAQFKLINGAKLQLNPSSQIRFQRAAGGGPLKVDVDVGAADVRSGTGAVTIGSEFGEIVLDANSAIRLSRDGDRMNVDVELGGIQVSQRKIAAGETVDLELGGIIVDVPPPAPEEPEPEPPVEDAGPPPEPELKRGDGVASADLVVKAGESFVVHDPNPPSAIGFAFGDLCDGPARLTAGAQSTEAKKQANLRFVKGKHVYKIYCLDTPKKVVASGQLTVLKDAGTRQLPTFTPTASVTTDGRRYTVMYQHKLPRVTVSWPTAPEAANYTLKIDGRSIQTSAPRHTFGSLRRGKHSIVFSAATEPPRQSRTTTVEVVYDRQAPAARVSNPPLDFSEGDSVTISGQALSGWDVSVDGKTVDVDSQQKFSIDVEGRESIPIAFTHPNKGTHYYLRRAKPKQ
jgi:hypothetical protein